MVDIDRAFQKVRDGHTDGLEVDNLLAGFWSGYPLQKLKELLNSDNADVVATATWMLSELGSEGHPLIDQCYRLISHSHHGTRFDVLDVILVNAGTEDSNLIAKALKLLNDDNASVRWMALNFSFRLSRLQLEVASQSHFSLPYRSKLEWLLRNDYYPDRHEVVMRLQSNNHQERKFAAIAAARMSKDDPEPINIAAQSQDQDVRKFASDFPK